MKQEIHYHNATFGCLSASIIVIVLFFIILSMSVSDSLKNINQEKQETERAEKFFDTMIEVEKIRSDRDETVEKIRSDKEKTIAKYQMIGQIKSSWPNTANKIINVLIGFSVVSFIILFIFGWVTHKRNKEKYEN